MDSRDSIEVVVIDKLFLVLVTTRMGTLEERVLHILTLLHGVDLIFTGLTPCEIVDAYIGYIIDF